MDWASEGGVSYCSWWLWCLWHYLSHHHDNNNNNSSHSSSNNNYNNNNNDSRVERCNSRFVTFILTTPYSVSNTYAPVTRTQSCASHMQLIKCLSHATWYEGTTQLLSLSELKSHLF